MNKIKIYTVLTIFLLGFVSNVEAKEQKNIGENLTHEKIVNIYDINKDKKIDDKEILVVYKDFKQKRISKYMLNHIMMSKNKKN